MANTNFKNWRRVTLLNAMKNGLSFGAANERIRGYSTGLALQAIGKAMVSPDTHIDIKDNYGTKAADENLKHIILNIIDDLHLVGFSIENDKLVYSLEYISEEGVEWKRKL